MTETKDFEKKNVLRQTIFIACSTLSMVLNFNFFAALLLNGWSWIRLNWLTNEEGVIILPMIYIFVHFYLVISYKK